MLVSIVRADFTSVEFALARGYPIERENYLNDLRHRPTLPWHFFLNLTTIETMYYTPWIYRQLWWQIFSPICLGHWIFVSLIICIARFRDLGPMFICLEVIAPCRNPRWSLFGSLVQMCGVITITKNVIKRQNYTNQFDVIRPFFSDMELYIPRGRFNRI